MRGRWLKIVALVAGFIVALAVVLVVLVKVLVTPERVRATVLPIAEKALHRPVELERIDVSLFSGISCRGLAIGARQGQGRFVEADALELRYRFWPLLFGRVVIDEARLERPVIRLSRDEEGRFNFADLLETGKDGRSGRASSESGQGTKIDLLVSRLSIGNGTVVLTDRGIRVGRATVTRLDELDLVARRLSLEGAFPLAFDFKLNDAPVVWDGTVDPAGRSISGNLEISGLAAGPLAPYLGDKLPGELEDLRLDADVALDGDAAQMTSRGVIQCTDIAMTLEAFPDAPLENAHLELDHDLSVEPERRTLTVRSLRLAFNRIALEVEKGTLAYGDAARLEAGVRLPRLELADLVASLPPALRRELSGTAPAGRVEAQFDLDGELSTPAALIEEGTLELEQAGFRLAHLEPRLTGSARLRGDELNAERLQLDLAGSRFALDLAAQRLFEEVKYLQTDLRSESVDLTALLPPEESGNAEAQTGKAKNGKAQTGKTKNGKGEQGEPLDLPLELDAGVRIDKGSYKGLELQNLQLDCRLADNVARCRDIGAETASGTLRGKAIVDLGQRRPTYDTNLQIKNVNAAELVTALAPRAADTVFGRLDLSMNLRGAGTQAETLKENLVGGGRFSIRNGELTGAGVMRGLAAFLDLDDLRVFRFDLGEGTFNIRDGGIFLDASFEGSKARLYPEGRIGLDRSLRLALATYLSPENTRKLAGRGTLGEVIADEKGWGLVPLAVGGTLGDPSFSLDRDALKEQVRKGAERKLKGKLREKIREQVDESTEEDDPAEKVLKDTLRGLFGN